MKRLIILRILFLSFFQAHAQTDTTFNAFQAEFETFLDSIETAHEQFLSESDSIFYGFLRSSWASYKTTIPEKTKGIKPVQQPTIPEDSIFYELEPEKQKDTSSVIIPNLTRDTVKLDKPEVFFSRAIAKEINYYGITESLYYFPEHKPVLKHVSDQGIADFFHAMAANKEWGFNLQRLYLLKKKHKLNDWGYYCLLQKASEALFPNTNEQCLFVWYMLLKSNYRVKTGYSNNSVLLMLSTRQRIYNTPYINLQGIDYFLINSESNKARKVTTYKQDYPTVSHDIDLRLKAYPLFDILPVTKTIQYQKQPINLKIDITLIDFLSGIPHCPLENYFHPSPDPDFWMPVDSVIRPLISEKTNKEKIDVLLDFIQQAIPYQTDQEQFGKEKYMFAEECLFYPYSDCEDRTVLLAQMVKHYTNLPSIAVEFPEHVALAVDLGEDGQGTFIRHKGKKYIICDPTYINAKSGMLPDEFKDVKPKIVIY